MQNLLQNDSPAILVVDDNPLIVNVLKGLLHSEHFEVLTSQNGALALEQLKRNSVDVIICDVMMPEMDGFELHAQVRAQSQFSHIPFIFLTALDQREEVHKALEQGADDYLVKPFDPQHLLALVRGKVDRSRKLRESVDQRYDAYRKKVIHTLSHEFRTPLVAINTGTELLIDQKSQLDGKKIENLLEAIRRGGHRLERLVNDFMLMQQIEAGIALRMFEQRAKPLLVAELLEQCAQQHAEQVAAEHFSWQLSNLCDPESMIRVYEPQILEVLARIIANALKFSRDQKQVELCAYQQSLEVVLEVRDRGMGIDPAKIKEAIDLFGQLDRERLEQQGGGFGLAIASRYTSINGGRLEFEPRSGGGACVALILPRVATEGSSQKGEK